MTLAHLVYLVCVLVTGSAVGQNFEVVFEWNYINFTWRSPAEYQAAVASDSYIYLNTPVAGLKYYNEHFYMAMPRLRPGDPVTLGFFPANSTKQNPLVTPYPSWEMNEISSCDNLQNVQSMEIDPKGIMWVIDGMRMNNFSKHCPAKLLLIDLNTDDIIYSYNFPEQVSLSNGGFLNDIVLDGDFAYLTDVGLIDPGLIVFQRSQDRSWKIRDRTMFPELNSGGISVDGEVFSQFFPIDGLARSGTTVYYCPLSGLNLYAISTGILQDEAACQAGDWRTKVETIGTKPSQSDGMVADNLGNLYYGLLPLYGVGRWNTAESYTESVILDQDRETMIWTDSWAFDDKGNIHLLANSIHKYFDLDYDLSAETEPKIRILRLYTGANSYLYA